MQGLWVLTLFLFLEPPYNQFHEVSFFRNCALSSQMYHPVLHEILHEAGAGPNRCFCMLNKLQRQTVFFLLKLSSSKYVQSKPEVIWTCLAYFLIFVLVRVLLIIRKVV